MVALVRVISLEWQKSRLMGVDLKDNEKKEGRYRQLFQEILQKREKNS